MEGQIFLLNKRDNNFSRFFLKICAFVLVLSRKIISFLHVSDAFNVTKFIITYSLFYRISILPNEFILHPNAKEKIRIVKYIRGLKLS